MTMPPPANPKIYHIVHVDRLPSIIADGYLWCDEEVVRRTATNHDMGTKIGMDEIKQRRLNELTLENYPTLYVGQCVPFYFCPRSVMLYLIYKRNSKLIYRGGQEPVVHLEADLRRSVAWAGQNQKRWAFTLSNAGSYYFEDRADLARLDDLDWDAIGAQDWKGSKKGRKQAEFLVEYSFPWALVSRIGVISEQFQHQVDVALQQARHQPRVEVRQDWYY